MTEVSSTKDVVQVMVAKIVVLTKQLATAVSAHFEMVLTIVVVERIGLSEGDIEGGEVDIIAVEVVVVGKREVELLLFVGKLS
jgi:hypothetical protein